MANLFFFFFGDDFQCAKSKEHSNWTAQEPKAKPKRILRGERENVCVCVGVLNRVDWGDQGVEFPSTNRQKDQIRTIVPKSIIYGDHKQRQERKTPSLITERM